MNRQTDGWMEARMDKQWNRQTDRKRQIKLMNDVRKDRQTEKHRANDGRKD